MIIKLTVFNNFTIKSVNLIRNELEEQISLEYS